MWIFVLLYIVLVVIYISTIGRCQTYNRRLFQTIICTILLVCIQGFRHETIGIDSYNAYRPFYEMAASGFDSLLDFDDTLFGFESGFVFFTKLLKTLGVDTQLFIFLCSVISIVPISYLFFKHTDNIPLAFIIYVSFRLYHFGFSGIRQSIAIAITVIAFEFIVKKKPIGFIITTILASTIHTSAILFLIAYPLYHKLRLTPKRLLFVATILVIGLFFLKPIVISVTSLIFGGEKYMNMLDSSTPSYNLMLLLIVFLLFTYLSKDEGLQPLRAMLLMAVVFQSLGLLSSAASRMAFYFMPYISVALPITTNTLKDRIVIEPLFIILFIILFFYFNGSGYLDVLPYKFYWE